MNLSWGTSQELCREITIEMKGLEEKPRSCLRQLSPTGSIPAILAHQNSVGLRSRLPSLLSTSRVSSLGPSFMGLIHPRQTCPPNAKRKHIRVLFLGFNINNSQTLSTYCVLATLLEFSFILQNLLRVYVMVSVESQFDKIYNHLGDKVLGVSGSEFLDLINEDGKSQPH